MSSHVRTLIAEDYDNSMPFLDGEIYGNIRKYALGSDWLQVAKWQNRIRSVYKQKDLKRLCNSVAYQPFRDSLDLLLPFPAILSSFRVGNLRRIFRMKCPEELAVSVRHVRDVWAKIMDGFDGRLLDLSTVERLQGRSPAQSAIDRDYIIRLFENKDIFVDIPTDSQRTVLEERVMGIETIIPSMTTFLENTKYLEPAAILLRQLLPTKFKGSIMEQMQRIHTGGESGVASNDFPAAYRRLWLIALRLFPYLTPFKPLKDRRNRKKEFCGDYLGFFVRSAAESGFKSIKIAELLSANPISDVLPEPDMNPPLCSDISRSWKLKNRCGMPNESMFEEISPYFSLENIYGEPQRIAARTDMTAFAVARDVFQSFFGSNLDKIPRVSPLDTPMNQDTEIFPRIPPPISHQISYAQATSDLGQAIGAAESSEQAEQTGERNEEDTNMIEAGPQPVTTGPLTLAPPPLRLDHTIQMTPALPTPFPATVNPTSERTKPPDSTSVLERLGIKSPSDLCPSGAREHFDDKSNRPEGYSMALYVYNHTRPHYFVYVNSEETVLQELANMKGWWFAVSEGYDLRTINASVVQETIKNSLVICGQDSNIYWKAVRDNEL